jgi:hypothetical protein
MLAFQSPHLLWALAGLAVPLYIHLIGRTPPRLWEFPSLRFLIAAPVPRHGRRRLSDPWLLLLRLLLFAALVLLAAGPYWQTPGAAAGVRQTRILLLDVSASMGGWHGLERARAQAVDLLDRHPDDAFGLVLFADAALTVLPPADAPDAVRAALATLTPTWFAARPEAGLAAARTLATGRAAHWHLLSDFQRSAWENLRWDLPAGVSVQLHPVGRPPAAANLAITDASAWLRADERIEVLATLRNDSATARTTTLSLHSAEGTRTQDLELGAGDSGTARFVLPAPAQPTAELSLPAGDAFAADDRWQLFLGDYPPVRVLAPYAVDGGADADAELFFLQTALSVRDRARGLHFQLRLADAGAALAPGADTAVLFLGHALPSALLTDPALPAFTAAGGTILLTLGADVPGALTALRAAGAAGWRYEGHSGSGLYVSRPERIGPVPAASRLAEVFADAAARDLYLASIHDMARLAGVPAEQVLLASESGHPLLIELPAGTGRWLVSTVPLHPAASDLPLRNAFLPLLHELLKVAAPADGGIRRAVCQSRPTPLQAAAGLDAARLQAPGVWLDGDLPWVINLDRRESDPAVLPAAELGRQAFGRADRLATATGATPPRTRPLWRWLALAALAAYALECILVLRHARAERAAATVPAG